MAAARSARLNFTIMAEVSYAAPPVESVRGLFRRAQNREDMLQFHRWIFFVVAAALLSPGAKSAQSLKPAATAVAQTAAKGSGAAPKQPLSVRVVAYEINARLDPLKRTIT